MTIALFPGSFDPITNGHLDVIKKAAKLFDQLYVVVMTNTHKKYLFSTKERTHLADASVQTLPNVRVLARPSSLTVKVAHELGAKAIVRGVRNTSDFLYEQQIAGMNGELAKDVQTVLLFTNAENSFIASSMVKEVARFDGPVEHFLPKVAAQALKKKMKNFA